MFKDSPLGLWYKRHEGVHDFIGEVTKDLDDYEPVSDVTADIRDIPSHYKMFQHDNRLGK